MENLCKEDEMKKLYQKVEKYEKLKQFYKKIFIIYTSYYMMVLVILLNSQIVELRETNLTYTGKYLIKIDGDINNVYYQTKCYMNTTYGTCNYNCHKTKNYENAENYAIEHCIEGETFVGYISTYNNLCYDTHSNSILQTNLKIYALLFVPYLFLVIIYSITFWHLNKNDENTENNENLIV